MTEQEAIKDIQRQLWEINMEGSDVVLSTESLRLAIKALKKLNNIKEVFYKNLYDDDISSKIYSIIFE